MSASQRSGFYFKRGECMCVRVLINQGHRNSHTHTYMRKFTSSMSLVRCIAVACHSISPKAIAILLLFCSFPFIFFVFYFNWFCWRWIVDFCRYAWGIILYVGSAIPARIGSNASYNPTITFAKFYCTRTYTYIHTHTYMHTLSYIKYLLFRYYCPCLPGVAKLFVRLQIFIAIIL